MLAMLGPHGFLGEGCLVGQPFESALQRRWRRPPCFASKASHASSSREPAQAQRKVHRVLLVRNIDLEEDLCDQLFNHSEKRLARVLLKLARLRQT